MRGVNLIAKHSIRAIGKLGRAYVYCILDENGLWQIQWELDKATADKAIGIIEMMNKAEAEQDNSIDVDEIELDFRIVVE